MELFISNDTKTLMYEPIVQEGIEWSTQRSGAPGKLVFKVVKDDILDISEGSLVSFSVHGQKIFWGYVFKQQRDKDQVITITAYDQIRYLKNKDTLNYEAITASQLIEKIAKQHKLDTGIVEDTKYIIPTRTEQNKSYLDMIEAALKSTQDNQKEMYIFYDDFGYLTLKSLGNMLIGEQGNYLAIDAQTSESFDYTSSIDENTFNKIKLVFESEKEGGRKEVELQDPITMQRWGELQYFDTYKEGENAEEKAKNLLKRYNSKTRNLKISNALGDTRVRGGSMIVVLLHLGDLKTNSFMQVESVKHTFKGSEHWMDLTLIGGEFYA